MTEEIDNAIKKLVEKSTANQQAEQALKFSQAALNLSHVKGNLEAIAKATKTKGASA